LFRLQEGTPPAHAEGASDPQAAAPAAAGAEAPLPRVGRPQHDVMAIVNGKDLSRPALVEACVRLTNG
jgi:hypothetical protein